MLLAAAYVFALEEKSCYFSIDPKRITIGGRFDSGLLEFEGLAFSEFLVLAQG